MENLTGSGSIEGSITISGSLTYNTLYGDKKIIGVEIKETTIEIAYRAAAKYTWTAYSTNTTPPDKVWKEVYGLKDGRMTLLQVINGKHNRSYTVDESFEFEE